MREKLSLSGVSLLQIFSKAQRISWPFPLNLSSSSDSTLSMEAWWCDSGVSGVRGRACSPTRAWRRRNGVCLSALASLNSNGELVSHFLIFRPVADSICHTLLKLSSLRVNFTGFTHLNSHEKWLTWLRSSESLQTPVDNLRYDSRMLWNWFLLIYNNS